METSAPPTLKERLRCYEFNAKLCGDRPVLKLSADEAFDVVSAAAQTLVSMLDDLDKWRGHSVTLNKVSWEIADALGLIPEGADSRWGDVLEDLPEACRLIRAARAAGL